MGWNIDPRSITTLARQRHALICRRLALEIGNRLILATPVDSGRARSNWLASAYEPRREIVEPETEAETLQQMARVIDKASEFPVIWITNNLPYIKRLNEGSSKKAPAGFVETAIDAAALPLVKLGLVRRER